MSVGSRSIVRRGDASAARRGSGSAANARRTSTPIAQPKSPTATSSNRRASAPKVVDAGGSATARRTAPASSARAWLSRSIMKSPPARMVSAIDSTSSPADRPRRRALIEPTQESMVAATPRMRSTSATRTTPGVREGSSAPTVITGLGFAIVFTWRVPFVQGESLVSQPRFS